MKIRLAPYYLSVFVICVSCFKEDVVKQEVPSIEDILIVNYPNFKFSFKKDTIPEVIYNASELPYTARGSRLFFKIVSNNSEKLEIQTPGASGIMIVKTDTFSLPFNDHFALRLTSKDMVEKVYTLTINVIQVNPPKFANLTVDLNQTGISPLTGRLSVTSDKPSKLTYTVKGRDGEDFSKSGLEFKTDNQLDILGLYPAYSNSILVKIEDKDGQSSSREIFVKTEDLPSGLPRPDEIKVNKVDRQNLNTRFILTLTQRTTGLLISTLTSSYPTIIDSYGRIRWYLKIPLSIGTLIKPLRNGHWLIADAKTFKEVDLLGNIYNTINLPLDFHHDFEQLPDGSIIYLSEKRETNNTIEDKVSWIEFPSGAVRDQINLYDLLDPTRPVLPLPDLSGLDWLHSNSIFFDAADNSVIISNRSQSLVCKIDLGSKSLKWMFSDPANWKTEWQQYLLKPNNSDFEYSYGQHSVLLNPFKPNTLVLFDNGNFRSYSSPLTPGNSYTRIVEYTINEQDKSIAQNFQFGKEYGSMLYAPYVGNVQCTTPDRFFICYGGILKDLSNNPVNIISQEGVYTPNVKNQVRFFEIDRNKNVYLDLSIVDNSNTTSGFRSYRAYSIDFK